MKENIILATIIVIVIIIAGYAIGWAVRHDKQRSENSKNQCYQAGEQIDLSTFYKDGICYFIKDNQVIEP